MKKYTITRHYAPHGTYGELTREDGTHVAYTCERPREGDHPCIPEGTYLLSRYDSPAHGPRTWQFDCVPDRTYIQIHVANWPSELLGCIAPGDRFGAGPNGEWGVWNSRKTYDKFMTETRDDAHIVIKVTSDKSHK